MLKKIVFIIFAILIFSCATSTNQVNNKTELDLIKIKYERGLNLFDMVASFGNEHEILLVLKGIEDGEITDYMDTDPVRSSLLNKNIKTFKILIEYGYKLGSNEFLIDQLPLDSYEKALRILKDNGYNIKQRAYIEEYNFEREYKMKSLPSPDSYPVLVPDMNYLYFEDSQNYPFDYNEYKNFSIVNAWWLSECAFLAYTHPGFARMAYKLAGFDNFLFFSGESTEAMLVWNENFAIISFRGTELKTTSAIYDIITDIKTIPVPNPVGGMVHRGFLQGIDEVWDGKNGLASSIKNIRTQNPNIPIWVTGHSLGGALATLCYPRIENPAGLYIYGSPRVGDKNFTKLFTNKNVWRVENLKDPVTMVPINIPQLNFYYESVGNTIYLNEYGKVYFSRPELSLEERNLVVNNTILAIKNRRENKVLEFDKRIDQDIADIRDVISKRKDDISLNIFDHMPIYYSNKLWNYMLEISY
ncbi:MAG: lipase family protein [Spirochaetales bacterium]|nr:lipase family protein [Spirochaetales bacterium]